ncbi:sodium-dependent transporter [Coxiella burnetii]|uniref:sodium-dependent transporter n=1 Tax=Coxiella burnetii TaxID=777 RepID=UPI0021B00D05|nr:sodium-dependent transporter [Coxiella burnetii]
MVRVETSVPVVRERWSSKLAFILAATGAAVGLGNIWRFPYMAGMYGGSAFLLIYLIFVLIIGLPIMIAEILIGRRSRKNPVDALITLAQESNHSRKWGLLGWLGALALLLILSFYSVVAGWNVAYLIKSFSNEFYQLNPAQITSMWKSFLANPWHLLGWHSIFMFLTMVVVAKGVKGGLEKATKFMMPALYVILFILVIYAFSYGNFNKGFHFLFDFNHSKITTSVVIAALGHAFFTLALGAGAMAMYGAYVPRNVNLGKTVLIVASLDVLVAILSGLAIFPIVFAYHLPPNSGPGLMYVTLPIILAHLSSGWFIGGLCFLLLLFAAWTSSINLAEPLVVILTERLGLKRTYAAIIIGLTAWFIGIGSVLSFNRWQSIKLHGLTIFDISTNLPTDIILPLGGLGFAIFAGWVMKKTITQKEVPSEIYSIWRFLVRYVAPLGILIVFISSI